MTALSLRRFRFGIDQSVLANAPLRNMRDTETSLILTLQLDQIASADWPPRADRPDF